MEKIKIREKNTAWLETIRSFLAPEDEKNNEYEEWKRANADIIDQKAILNLEKMIERQAKRREKTKIQSRKGNNDRLNQSQNKDIEVGNRENQQGGQSR